MPNNAATEAARLSAASMKVGADRIVISRGCSALCAAHVHLSIAWALTSDMRLLIATDLPPEPLSDVDAGRQGERQELLFERVRWQRL